MVFVDRKIPFNQTKILQYCEFQRSCTFVLRFSTSTLKRLILPATGYTTTKIYFFRFVLTKLAFWQKH